MIEWLDGRGFFIPPFDLGSGRWPSSAESQPKKRERIGGNNSVETQSIRPQKPLFDI
jgi:hypothetical protein